LAPGAYSYLVIKKLREAERSPEIYKQELGKHSIVLWDRRYLQCL